MTRNAKRTDGLETTSPFREEETSEYDGAEALQEEVEELLSDGEGEEEDGEFQHEQPADSPVQEFEDWQRPSGGGGAVGFALGALLACAGIALGAAPKYGFGQITQTLGELGIEAGTFVTVGLVLVFLSGIRGYTRGNAARMTDLEQFLAHQTTELQQNVDYLVEQQRLHGELPPASGEELDRVLVVMHRLDEKINNLTKAFKMYGKPLVEISNQSTDIASEVNELHTLVQGVLESMVRGFRRSEESLSAMTEVGVLQEELRSTIEEVQKATRGEGALQEQLRATVDQLQSAVQESFERVQQELATMADQIADNGALGSGLRRLEARLDETFAKVTESIQNAGASGFSSASSDLEDPIREIQREVATIANTLANLQLRIGTGGGGRQASQPAPGAPQGSAAPPPQASDGGGGNVSSGVLAHSISGTKRAGGKNVLGAIAKLRQMRH